MKIAEKEDKRAQAATMSQFGRAVQAKIKITGKKMKK